MADAWSERAFIASSRLNPLLKTERGFDFLGYRFGPEGFTLAAKTIERFVARAIRLYEQEPGETLASARLGLYVRQWVRWAGAGLNTRTEIAVAIFESTGTAS